MIDGQELKATDFSPQQWDKIKLPIVYYSKQDEWNSYMFSEIHRLTGINDTSRFLNNMNKHDFISWYQQYLSALLHKKVITVDIQTKTYQP